MDNPQNQFIKSRKNLKRKLEQDFEDKEDRKIQVIKHPKQEVDVLSIIRCQVEVLNSTYSADVADRSAAKQAAHIISDYAKHEDNVDMIVECGAIPALVKHLQAPPSLKEDINTPDQHVYDVEKGVALALGLIAIKPEHQYVIADAGALSPLVSLIKKHRSCHNSRSVNGVVSRAADAIANLAHENHNIKSLVRIEGGIPPLVELLECADIKLQRAAALALRTLAFKNDENKDLIIQCNALPSLVLMLRSSDTSIHYNAIGVIGNLVHSSPDIKKEVLLAGALQPVIRLLCSSCEETQREAALLIGQFAAADSDCKIHIAQRGAIQPLIEMLYSLDAQLKEMAAFALGRLAQDTHTQAGIAQSGGIIPLLELLESRTGPLQHNAAFALYGLTDNEDNVADIITLGGFQKLQEGEFLAQPTKDCVAKTLKRLEEKIDGQVLNHLLMLMRDGDETVQTRVVLALAHLCDPDDREKIFIDNKGLELLLGLLDSELPRQHWQYGSAALYKLATKGSSLSPLDAAPSSPNPQVFLGERYINNPLLSDITFLIEGKQFHSHKICLLASSDTFRAMFDGGYKEKSAKHVEIPNIRWDVFELMMRFIYTGSVDINIDDAEDLLKAADQYLLEGLKRLCEYSMAQHISFENVSSMYDLSEAYNATSLKQACILFILQHFNKLSIDPWFGGFIERVIPDICTYFTDSLTSPMEANDQKE